MKLSTEYVNVLKTLINSKDKAGAVSDAKEEIERIKNKYSEIARRKQIYMFSQADREFEFNTKQIEKMSSTAELLIIMLSDPEDVESCKLAEKALLTLTEETKTAEETND